MGTKMTDILLSNFNNLFRLEGDLNSHCQAIAKNRKEIEKLSEANKICLRDQIKNFLTNEHNLKQQLSLSIFHLSIYASYFHDEQIDDYIQRIFNKISGLENKNAFIYNLVTIGFRKNLPLDKPLAKIFNSFVMELKDEYSDLRLKYDVNQNKKTILLVSSQILSANHSPTQLLLELYTALRELGFEVLVAQIQSLSTHDDLPFIEPFKGRYIDTPEGLRIWNFDGREIPIYNFAASHFKKSSLEDFLKILEKIQPGFMINVGGYNGVQEFIASQIPSLIYTTSSMLVPSPFSSLVSVFEKLSSTQIMALEDAQIDPNKYKKMVSKAVQQDSLMGRELTNRSEFGYKDEDILLAIVSNRLDWEIGFDEIEFINKTLKTNPRIKFLLVGRCEDALVTKIARMCGPRAEFLEPITEIKTFLSMIDFLVNTKRLGGGGAAATAIGHGTPVFSINYGDVSSILPSEYLADDYTELLGLIIHHLELDKATRQQIAYSIFDQFPKFKDNVQKLIRALEWKHNKDRIHVANQKSQSSIN